MKTQKIAFIGLGAMGLPMASNLAKKGFNVHGYDNEAAKVEALVQAGGSAGSSIAQVVHNADVVLTMLPATPHVQEVVCGAGGVLEHISPSALLIEMSTIDPHATDALIQACRAQSVAYIDAPVGRLVSHAQRGESLFMVGAEDSDFVRVEPILLGMGTTIHRCGKPGMGIRTKVVNNFLIISMAQLTAETIVLGTKLGLDVDTMKTVSGDTTGTNGQFQINFASKTLVGDIEPGFTIDLAHKDLTLAMNAAALNRLGLPVGAAAHAALGAARSTAYAAKDFTGLLDYASDLAGIEKPQLTQR